MRIFPVFVVMFLVIVFFVCGCCNHGVFTVATFNVRCPVDKTPNSWDERKDRCLEVIKNNEMDIFGTQEAVLKQLQDLTSNGEYAFIGSGRNDFKNGGEFSAIIYRKKRFEVLDSGTFGLSEKPEVPGYKSWGTAWPRIATWGLFKDKKSGRKFLFYNTHLDNKSNDARVNGIKMIVRHARAKANSLPLILTGDFNTLQGSETYRTAASLLKDSAVISETPHIGAKVTYTGYGKSKKQRTIDFIFVSDDFRVLTHKTDDTRINGQYPSDHDPVIAEVQIK